MNRSVQLRRWVTALVLLGLVVPLMRWGGPWPFLSLVAVTVVMCQWELQALAGRRLSVVNRALESLLAAAIPVGAMLGQERGLLLALVGSLLFWMVFDMMFKRPGQDTVAELGGRMFAYLYGAVLPSYFILIWQMEHGIHWIFATLAIVFVGDTAAYYLGSMAGRIKLRPIISPNKTVEGAVAGLMGNAAAGMAYALALFPGLLSPKGVIFSVLVGGIGQLGDLSESMLKRSVGVKDSSGLLPGHGGVLDRLDSLLFAAPFVYYWALSC